jgi:prefoldin subunit 5
MPNEDLTELEAENQLLKIEVRLLRAEVDRLEQLVKCYKQYVETLWKHWDQNK